MSILFHNKSRAKSSLPEKMKDFQTSLKSSDLISRESHLRKPQKVPQKSLNGLFSSVSDNITPEPSDYSPISDITQFSASSADVTPIVKFLPEPNANVAVERFKFNNVEADVMVSLLKEARTEITHSADVDFKSKKVVDALIELVINEYNNSCTGAKERCTELVLVKIRVAVLCLTVWSIALFGILVYSKELNDYSYSGTVPT